MGKAYSNMKGVRSGCIIILVLTAMLFPFAAVTAERTSANQIVVIDPAHGGIDRGVKLSDKEWEKDVTLKIALQMQKYLQEGGNIRVRLSRTADRDVSVSERLKTVSASGAGIFISLHVNAGFGRNAAGYEVYFPGFNAAAAEKNGADGILRDMAANKYLNGSVSLSKIIQRNLQVVFPGKDRDLRSAPMLILEGLNLPAVVVEIGFATNKSDNKTITDEKGRRAIAQALSRSVKEFIRSN
jgi:N-acetylmuramoyl-L-alanine amidase